MLFVENCSCGSCSTASADGCTSPFSCPSWSAGQSPRIPQRPVVPDLRCGRSWRRRGAGTGTQSPGGVPAFDGRCQHTGIRHILGHGGAVSCPLVGLLRLQNSILTGRICPAGGAFRVSGVGRRAHHVGDPAAGCRCHRPAAAARHPLAVRGAVRAHADRPRRHGVRHHAFREQSRQSHGRHDALRRRHEGRRQRCHRQDERIVEIRQRDVVRLQ